MILMIEKIHSYEGHPSKVDTVKRVSIALATSSKWNELRSHFLSSFLGVSTSPWSNFRYKPLSNENY